MASTSPGLGQAVALTRVYPPAEENPERHAASSKVRSRGPVFVGGRSSPFFLHCFAKMMQYLQSIGKSPPAARTLAVEHSAVLVVAISVFPRLDWPPPPDLLDYSTS